MAEMIEVLGSTLMVPMRDGRRKSCAPRTLIGADDVQESFLRLLRQGDPYITRFAALRQVQDEPADGEPQTADEDDAAAAPVVDPEGQDADPPADPVVDPGDQAGSEERPPSPETPAEGSSQSNEAASRGTDEDPIDWDELSKMTAPNLVTAALKEPLDVIRQIIEWEEKNDARVTVLRPLKAKLESGE